MLSSSAKGVIIAGIIPLKLGILNPFSIRNLEEILQSRGICFVIDAMIRRWNARSLFDEPTISLAVIGEKR
jgi:transposase-like protein